MFRKTFTSLAVAALCLSLSATSAHAQFNIGGKLGSISKKARSKVSAPAKSFPKPKLTLPSPTKGIGSIKPKLPVKFPKTGPITLPKRGIGISKPPVKLPKTGPITLPKPGFGLPKPGPITLPKPPIKFPKPGTGIVNPLPIKFPKPGPIVRPKPGPGPIVPPNPGITPLPKPGPGPIVPPNPGITPLPKPIKYPQPDGCWKPPHRCHWWIDLCTPIRLCRPVDVVRCHWNYVRCDAVIGGHVVADSRWFLGLEGVFLPGKGLGIESVVDGSPAAMAGLTAGMVITEVNGIAMQSEEAMQQAIATSQGTLDVILLAEGSEQLLQTRVEMVRLVSARF